MILSHDRKALRKQMCEAWAKHQAGAVLSPLEQSIVDVVLWHPEWHALLENEASTTADFGANGNPYFHLALHLGLREQLSTDRPHGIRALYHRAKIGHDAHEIEHRMMRVLAESFSIAAQKGAFPDVAEYLLALQDALRS